MDKNIKRATDIFRSIGNYSQLSDENLRSLNQAITQQSGVKEEFFPVSDTGHRIVSVSDVKASELLEEIFSSETPREIPLSDAGSFSEMFFVSNKGSLLRIALIDVEDENLILPRFRKATASDVDIIVFGPPSPGSTSSAEIQRLSTQGAITGHAVILLTDDQTRFTSLKAE